MELKIDAQARGVRIITGEETRNRRVLLNQLISVVEAAGFGEIILPSIEPSQIYTDKAGLEILGQMYTFQDKNNRELCLRPEATATVQLLAEKHFKRNNNVKLWYFERCWRYERPAKGRYREFFQFGVEVLQPTDANIREELIALAESLIQLKTRNYELNRAVKRGLDYYT